MDRNRDRKQHTILIAEDDEEDLLLTLEALKECQVAADLQIVRDGEELMDYLSRLGKYRRVPAPHPDLILLDLRMPKKDGYEALKEIKADPDLRFIPIVVLTTSRVEEDVYGSYALGVNSYITKPNSYDALVDAMRVLKKYWFDVVSLPQ